MAVSKKKRKNGTVKKSASRSYLKVTHELIELFRSSYTHAELAVEYKLHRGEANFNDILYMKDLFNLATVGFITRAWLDQEALKDFEPDFIKAKNHFERFWLRGRDKGHWVCTGEELASIRDAIAVIGQYVRDSLDDCPRRMIKEWIVMDTLTQMPQVMKKKQVTKEEIDRELAKLNNGRILQERMLKMIKTKETFLEAKKNG